MVRIESERLTRSIDRAITVIPEANYQIIIPEKPKNLSELQISDLQRALAPQELIDQVNGRVDVLKLSRWIGRMDQEYMPSLFGVTIGREMTDECLTQENESTLMGEHMNLRREELINNGVMSQRDKLLLALIADDKWSKSKGMRGVSIESIALAEDIRGKGIGTSFYEHLGDILRMLGYQYVYGEHNKNNLPFFLKQGVYLKHELNGNGRHLIPERVQTLGGIQAIKFLDLNLEYHSVI